MPRSPSSARRIPALLRRGGRSPVVSGGSGPPAPVQLLDFDGAGATFSRNNGSGANGEASARGSAATFADYATNVLRTETLGGVARYLFERQRSSLVVRSDDWSAGWGKTSVTTTYGATGPKGDATATQADYAALANAAVSQTISGALTSDNDIVTISVWARGAVGGEQLRLGGLRKNATETTTVITLTTEWAQYSYTYDVLTTVGAGNTTAFLRNSVAGTAKTIYIQRFGYVVERYLSSRRLLTTSVIPRYADSLLFAPDEVPLALRESAWTVNVRPTWVNTDLTTGEKRVICSTDANNWIGFEESGGAVYLRCYTGGVLRFGTGALTIARDTDYPIVVDLAGGQMTFNGVAGSVGTATTLPAGAALRWGGIAGGADELDAGTSEPFTVA